MVLSEPDQRPNDQLPVRTSGIGWLAPLIVLTVADYAWQVPYAVHQYGTGWHALPGLSVLLVLSFGWFCYGIWLQRTAGRGATVVLAGLLVAEVAYYLLHNATGAFLADLLLSDPVLLVASILGYLNTIVAVCYLIALLHRGTAAVTGHPPVRRTVDRTFRAAVNADSVNRHAGR